MARDTEIPYMTLYNSLLDKDKDRNLRVGEFFKICDFLGVEPGAFKG